MISIHALLAESDGISRVKRLLPSWISIHALLAESDPRIALMVGKPPAFLSTLSLRRATSYSQHVIRPSGYFYPRSPCGERPRHQAEETAARLFLSTLSLRRATNCTSIGRPKRLYFYPRSPCGERRYLINTYHRIFGISIHALLAESDFSTLDNVFELFPFLSTLSLRRATLHCQL